VADGGDQKFYSSQEEIAKRIRDLANEGLEYSNSETGYRDLRVSRFEGDMEPILDDAWLVEDVLPMEGLGVAYGAPGSGKTFMALDLAMAVAGATSQWRDKYVEHGAVLYFSMEGGRVFRNREVAYRREKGYAPHFYRSAETLDLRSSEDDANAIISECMRISESDRPVRLVVVDTLNRAMAGGSENAPEDMGAFISICEAIRKEVGCYLLIIHHCGKDEARGMRGHSSLLGAVDTELHVDGNHLVVSKQRDGMDGLRFGYELRTVELGVSPRGKMITSKVIDATDAGANAKGLTPKQRKALEALRQYIDDHGKPNPGGTGWPEPGSHKVVETEQFVSFLSGKMTNNTEKERRRSARSAVDALQMQGVIQINEGFLWLI